MFGLGFGELLIILVIVLLVFGAGKLPQIGDALGRSIKNFKRAAAGDNEIEVSKKKQISAGKKAKAALPAEAEAEDDEQDEADEADDGEEAEVVPARSKKRKID